MSYKWEKAFTISGPLLTGTINVSGVPEIGQEQTITVGINNGRTTDSTGRIVVEIRRPDETIVATLDSGTDITIAAGQSWANAYTWTPRESGDYKAVGVYTEA